MGGRPVKFVDAFVPFPSTAEESWARLHAFTAEWWRAPGVGEGVPSATLDRAEKRLRAALPSAVRNMYCFFGRYPEVTRGQINLVKPEDLAIQDDVLVPVLTGAELRVPLPMRILTAVPPLQRLLARVIGMGVRPEHVRSPSA